MPKVFQTIFGLFYIHFVNNTSFACSDDDVKFCLHTTTNNNTASLNQMSLFWSPVRGVLYVPRLNFKRFHVAISDGLHVAAGISPKDTDIDIDK